MQWAVFQCALHEKLFSITSLLRLIYFHRKPSHQQTNLSPMFSCLIALMRHCLTLNWKQTKTFGWSLLNAVKSCQFMNCFPVRSATLTLIHFSSKQDQKMFANEQLLWQQHAITEKCSMAKCLKQQCQSRSQ